MGLAIAIVVILVLIGEAIWWGHGEGQRWKTRKRRWDY